MRRRDFLKASAAGILAVLTFTPNANIPPKDKFLIGRHNTNVPTPMDVRRGCLFCDIKPQDRKILEMFLTQLAQDKEPDYSLQELERNMLFMTEYGQGYPKDTPKDSRWGFNGTLINSDGYFYTVNHYSFPLYPDNKFTVTSQGERCTIERIILAYDILHYDFIIGKVSPPKNLSVTPLVYSTNRNIGQSVIGIPSPVHPYREKVHGKIISRKPKGYVGPPIDPCRFYTSLDMWNGHSGSLIVTPKLKVVGLAQRGSLEDIPFKFPCEGLKVEYIEQLIRYRLSL